MSIRKIVLTGGPCAGKSTGLTIVKQRLEEIGYKVIVMDEMATQVINSGLSAKNLGAKKFQNLLIDMQLSRDSLYKSYLKPFETSDKIVILFDRGIIDGFAYCDPVDFIDLLEKNNHQYYEIMNYYDAVFHLTTAAKGAEQFYTLANNPARMETVEEAKEADSRTLRGWMGHPHLRVIGNDGVNFEGKMNELMKEIMDFLGEPIPLEKERKFIVAMPEFINYNNPVVLPHMVCTPIIQTYLKSTNGERRIRQRGFQGDYSYYYTEKIPVQNGKTYERIEKERTITEREYNTLMTEADPTLAPLHKQRYCFVYKDKYFELDVYPYWKDFAVLEIETDDEFGVIEVPDNIKIIQEVTNNINFSNHELCKHTNNPNYLNDLLKDY